MDKLQNNFEEVKSFLDKLQTNLVEKQVFEMRINELEKELTNVTRDKEIIALEQANLYQQNQKLKFEIQKVKKNNLVTMEERKNG